MCQCMRAVPDPDGTVCPLTMAQVHNKIFIVNYNSSIHDFFLGLSFIIYMYIGDNYALIAYIRK